MTMRVTLQDQEKTQSQYAPEPRHAGQERGGDYDI